MVELRPDRVISQFDALPAALEALLRDPAQDHPEHTKFEPSR
jgi:hypothetical protein